MSSRGEKAQKQLREKHQAILNELLREDANRYCADCESKGPRWSSWNIGVFVCIRCAGIHRNLGVHISKVKSVNLDSWTPEQIDNIQKWGNKRCKECYECYLPDDFQRPHGDSAMEQFIRNKYERKLYKKKDGEPPPNKAQPQEAKKAAKPAAPKEEKKKQTILSVADSGNQASTTRTPPATRTSKMPSTAIPRPHGSNTTSIPASATAAPQQSTGSSQVADLLALDDHASASTPAAPVSVSSPSANELNLFGVDVSAPSQTFDLFQSSSGNALTVDPSPHMTRSSSDSLLIGEPEKAMSTKESILSLYQSSSQNQQQKVYNIPGGMYMTQQKSAQGQYQGFNQMPNMQQPTSQGMRLPQQPGMQAMGMGQSGVGFQQGQQPYHQQMRQPMSHLNLQMHQLHLSHSLPSLHQAGFTGSPTQPNQGQLNQQQLNQAQPRLNQPGLQYGGFGVQQQYGGPLGWNANQGMMQARQPIPASGPSMGFAQSTVGNMQNPGHTMNTQLWK